MQARSKNKKGKRTRCKCEPARYYRKDANDILFGIEQGVDFIAASFVRRASDVLEIRELLERIMRLTFKSFLRLKTKRVLITSMKSLRYQTD
ncbi:pyruvate kinase [Bacillus sp. SL00103]